MMNVKQEPMTKLMVSEVKELCGKNPEHADAKILMKAVDGLTDTKMVVVQSITVEAITKNQEVETKCTRCSKTGVITESKVLKPAKVSSPKKPTAGDKKKEE